MNITDSKQYEEFVKETPTNTIELFEKVREWAGNKELLDPAKIHKQMFKLIEELGETAEAIIDGNEHETKDGFGDVLVVWIIMAAQAGYNLEDCLQYAYDEIKNRTGKTVNGIFVKDNV